VRSSFLLGTSRSSFSDESSIIGKYDKRAAPPTKGIGTVKNLTELTLQIRTYLAIGGPSEVREASIRRERRKGEGGLFPMCDFLLERAMQLDTFRIVARR